VPSPLSEQLLQIQNDYRHRFLVPGMSLEGLLREKESIEGVVSVASAGGSSGGDPGTNVAGIDSAIEQVAAMVSSPVCPILAVVGMLNAGKSSLVATFLSGKSEGDQRVLIGSGNTEGTHRFVLWLPESWRSNEVIWGYLTQRLTHVFGSAPEDLSRDAMQASRQYNDLSVREVKDVDGKLVRRHAIEIPLVATDAQLDRLGIALMDCPDVQTGLMTGWGGGTRLDELSMAASQERFAVLERASVLCGAFVLVLPANAMHDQMVSRLLKMLEVRMPHVQRIMAVNRVPRKYDASEISEEMHRLYGGSQPSRVYMAYHFHGPERRERLSEIPVELREMQLRGAEVELPAFFRIDQRPVPQPPSSVPEEAWMLRLGCQLEGNVLLADAIDSSVTTLRVRLCNALQVGRGWVERSNERLDAAHRILADACLDFSVDPGSPLVSGSTITSGNTVSSGNTLGPSSSGQMPRIRLQASRQIVEQIANSLEKTAPWWARPGRWVQRLAQASKDSVGYATSWVKMPSWMIERGNAAGEWIRTRFQRGDGGKVVTADALVEALRRRNREGLFGLDEDVQVRQRLRVACQCAIDRFQQESATQLDSEQVDRLTERLWEQMPVGKRILSGVAPAGILFAPLLAVIMLPLDFGGSSVLVFASLKELLFAGAAGVGLVLASSDAMPQMAENESAWQQLFDLIAVLTDELGFDRRVGEESTSWKFGGVERRVGESSIVAKRHAGVQFAGIPASRRAIDELVFDGLRCDFEGLQRDQSRRG